MFIGAIYVGVTAQKLMGRVCKGRCQCCQRQQVPTETGTSSTPTSPKGGDNGENMGVFSLELSPPATVGSSSGSSNRTAWPAPVPTQAAAASLLSLNGGPASLPVDAIANGDDRTNLLSISTRHDSSNGKNGNGGRNNGASGSDTPMSPDPGAGAPLASPLATPEGGVSVRHRNFGSHSSGASAANSNGNDGGSDGNGRNHSSSISGRNNQPLT
jgi:hypothetical protein